MRRKEDPIFKTGDLVEYQETIQYDAEVSSVFMYILEVLESHQHRQEYAVLVGGFESKLIFDCTMGLPRWYLLDGQLRYIRPIASYDDQSNRTINPRLFTW